MTSNDLNWSVMLDFTIFSKNQEITEIDTKSGYKWFQNVQFHEFVQFDEENWKKKLKKYLKTVEFWLDLHVIWLMPSQRQNVILMHTVEISTFLHRLKEQLLKVSALSRKPSFQNFEKNLFGGRHPVPIAKRYCYKKMWIKKYFCASKNTLKFNIFPEQKQT